MVYHSLLKGFNTFSELKTLIEIFLKILSSLKHFPGILCPYRLQPLHSNKDITENNPAFLLQSSLNLTLIQILLRNIRLSNFKLSSVLSFADKPKLTYLTRPIKNKKKTRKLSAKIDTNSNLTFESKMNLKSICVCTKSIKITAILVTFLRWLRYS